MILLTITNSLLDRSLICMAMKKEPSADSFSMSYNVKWFIKPFCIESPTKKEHTDHAYIASVCSVLLPVGCSLVGGEHKFTLSRVPSDYLPFACQFPPKADVLFRSCFFGPASRAVSRIILLRFYCTYFTITVK